MLEEKHQAPPCAKPCVCAALNYSHLVMTKISASALPAVTNNQEPQSGKRGWFIHSFITHVPLSVHEVLTLFPSLTERQEKL